MFYQSLMNNQIEQLQREIQELRDILGKIISSDKSIFPYNSQILDGRNIQLGRTTGTIIGTETDQKLGFMGKTPVIQQDAITAPAGGDPIDTQARTAINTIITTLETFGFVAPN